MHECKRDSEIQQLKIDVAVAKSDIQAVKQNLQEIKNNLNKLHWWIMGVMATGILTFITIILGR